MSAELWTPERDAGERLWTPMRGRVRLQVGWPDNPGDPGEVCDTDWLHNDVLAFVPYVLWGMLGAANNSLYDRFYDGANVGPAFAEMFSIYQTSATASALLRTAAANTSVTSPVSGPVAFSYPYSIFNSLFGGVAIGNYVGAAPAGAVSHFVNTSWTTYSLVRRFMCEPPGTIFPNANVYYGPAITSDTLSGVGPPNPTTTITRQFATQAGTVNAIAFVPLTPTFQTTAAALPNAISTNFAGYARTQPGGPGSSFSWSLDFYKVLAASGDPFGAAGPVLASTFALLSSPVTVPTGAQLTMAYTFSATL